MKRIITVAVVAAFSAFASRAEWKTIGTVQLADNVSLAQGVAKLGEFTGNAMIGMMAAGALNEMPGSLAFGPARPGAATLYPFFVENGQYEFAILYPVSIDRDAFLKKYPDAIESNGLIRVSCPIVGKKKSVCYVAFSSDGKWAGFSDKPQQARLAVVETAVADKPLDGDMLRVRILRRGLDEFAKGGEQEMDVKTKDLVDQLESAVFGLRVSDRGLDFRGALKTRSGTELSKIGANVLATDALSFAGKDSVSACACAAGCSGEPVEKTWNEIKPIVEKAGFPLDWIEFGKQGDNSRFTVDVDKLIADAKAHEKQSDPKSGEKLLEGLGEYFSSRGQEKFKADGPAVNCETALKGYVGRYTPQQRFDYTLPESKNRKPFSVGFCSVYSVIRSVLPACAKASPEAFAGSEAVIAAMPAEGQGGLAYMAWTENDTLRYFARVGADEFKAVSAGFAAFAMMSAGDSDDDDDDDEDASSDNL